MLRTGLAEGVALGFVMGCALGIVEEDGLTVGTQVEGSAEGDSVGPKEDGFAVGAIERESYV